MPKQLIIPEEVWHHPSREPDRILTGIWQALHQFSEAETEEGVNKAIEGFAGNGVAVARNKLEELRADFLPLVRDAGMDVENARSVYSQLVAAFDAIQLDIGPRVHANWQRAYKELKRDEKTANRPSTDVMRDLALACRRESRTAIEEADRLVFAASNHFCALLVDVVALGNAKKPKANTKPDMTPKGAEAKLPKQKKGEKLALAIEMKIRPECWEWTRQQISEKVHCDVSLLAHDRYRAVEEDVERKAKLARVRKNPK